MNAKKNIILATMGLVMAATAVTGASAETRFDRTHPARAEVNGRLANENHRIVVARGSKQIFSIVQSDIREEYGAFYLIAGANRGAAAVILYLGPVQKLLPEHAKLLATEAMERVVGGKRPACDIL